MKKLNSGIKYFVISVLAFVSLFPFVWMIIGATNTSTDIVKGSMSIGTELFTNISRAFSETYIGISLVNSLVIVVAATIFSLIFCSMAGYSFVVYPSKSRGWVMGFILFSMMIPFAATMIPVYKLFGQLGLLDKYMAVILPNVATGFLIFFFRQNTKSFPIDLIQAARIDGLNEFQIFFKIYMPTMKSTFSAAAIMAFMANWNNYMWPMITLQSQNKMTLPVIISSMSSSPTPDYGVIMVSLVIATIPTALVFFLLQKNFVEGMVGSVKG